MALVGDIIANARGDSAAVINYTLFVTAWVLLTLIYLIPASISEKAAFHPSAVFIIDMLNLILTFCAAIALPSKLHVINCSSDEATLRNSIARTGASREKACREAQAATAFMWFLWFTVLISTMLATRNTIMAVRGPAKPRTGRGPAPQPSMSQV
jgi:hypothetical protein